MTQRQVRVRVPPNRSPGTPRAQKTVATQDSDFAVKRQCEFHLIEYYSNMEPRCPMCQSDQVLDQAKQRLVALERENESMRNQLQRLQVQVNLTSAIREAIGILDDRDYVWLKTQMYQYKIDKSVSLKPTHGQIKGGRRLRRGEHLPVNGFMTVPRRGDPEAHMASSIGGIAMAEYLEEAINTAGIASAMGTMLKAWVAVLPGGIE